MPRKAANTTVEGLRFTSPDRLVYPESGITKLQLAEHYLRVAPRMLPHLERRPVTMIRCPDTWQKCFFQKHIDEASHYAGVAQVWLDEGDGKALYGAVNELAGLVSLVQLGVVEFHTPGIRADNLDKPDRFVLDLDPDEGLAWVEVVAAAAALRELLQELGLVSFVKTTGGKGLHVVVPIRRSLTVPAVRDFTGAIASLFESVAPDKYTTNVSKAKRSGRILIDYIRNAPGATAVEVYSARARSGAPVATPVAWDELEDIRGDSFTVTNLQKRLASLRADPWSDFFDVKQSISAKARRQLGLG